MRLAIAHASSIEPTLTSAPRLCSEAAIVAWKHQADHAAVRVHGRSHWYHHFELRVAKVERAYGKIQPR